MGFALGMAALFELSRFIGKRVRTAWPEGKCPNKKTASTLKRFSKTQA